MKNKKHPEHKDINTYQQDPSISPSKNNSLEQSNTHIHVGAEYVGVISLTPYGVGFVSLEGIEQDILIDPDDTNTALHNDVVLVRILPRRKNDTRTRGEVVRVEKRAKTRFVGVVYKEKGLCFVDVDDRKFYTSIRIPESESEKLISGLKVLVEMKEWTNQKTHPEGTVVEIFGPAGEHGAEMRSIVAGAGFDYSFPPEVEEVAKKLAERREEIFRREIARRKDYRNRITFTIDPHDAKDFDDALSILKNQDGTYEIGVHIADVTAFVKRGDAIDKEAAKRATSIYLVDRTIPMLPEVLSNDLCSLNPFEDKLTFSVIFILTKDGEVKNYSIEETVIRSDKRFTYAEAQRILDTGSGTHADELAIFRDIGRVIRNKRFKDGAINFETDEVEFELDKDGAPVRIYKKERLETHELIEDFMLLANRTVAEYMANREKNSNAEKVFVYRIHDVPKEERIDNLSKFLKALGYKLKTNKEGISVKDLNALLKEVDNTPEEDMIKTATIRSMAKAIYSLNNIGHFGLAFAYYTHFTSPIRRYPDIMVHRLIKAHLNSEELPQHEFAYYQRMVAHSSEREVAAVNAERESIKLKQVEYMTRHIGKTFNGVVSGVSEWGAFVEELETQAEGMVHLRDMKDDFYILDPHGFQLVGKNTGRKIRLGDKVRVKLISASISEKTLNWVFV